MSSARWLMSGLLGASTLFLAGCPFFPPIDNPNGGGGKSSTLLKPFNSESELLNYVRDQARAQRTGFGIGRGGQDDFNFGGPLPVSNEATGGAAPPATDGDASGAPDFTGTNVQEAGVDESDFIKTDGRYFYVARGKALRILDTKGADGTTDDLREIAVLDLEARADSIYLLGDKLILLSQDYGNGYGWGRPEILIWPPYYNNGQLKVFEIDIADPENPAIARSVELDGALVTSRLLNGRLVLVLTVSPVIPTTGSVASLTLEEVLPKLRHDDGEEALVAEWDAWLRPEFPEGLNMTAVVTLDAANIETIVDSVAVMANAGTVYSSANALYVTDTTYDIENDFRPETAIHKFSYGDDGAARYVATGNVRGRPLNQFSLGEANGALRVATQVENFQFFGGDDVVGIGFGGGATEGSVGVATDAAPPANAKARLTAQAAADEFPEGISTAVFVLGESEGRLNTLGRIIGIKPGERMYSARFLGNRGYLVTFRQIDPLFVLDLADNASPRITGELEIPGFSEYLHPVGDTHLIGVGRSTLQTPWGGTIAGGVQVSLFNVSDPANPTAVEQITFGGNGSFCDVSYDHKAFTLLERDGEMLLAVPVQLWNYDFFGGAEAASSIDPPFDGVVVLDVDLAAGFTERGRVASVVEGPDDYNWVEWRRGVVIDDDLFALSSGGVRSAKLSDLSPLDSVQFPPRWDNLPIPIDFVGGGDGVGGTEPGVSSPGSPGR